MNELSGDDLYASYPVELDHTLNICWDSTSTLCYSDTENFVADTVQDLEAM